MDEVNNNTEQQVKQKRAPRTAEERLAELEAKEAKAKEAERKRKSEMNKLKKEMEMKKQEALLHNLKENEITTENQVKALCQLEKIIKEFGIQNTSQFRQIMEHAKRTAPQLFPQQNEDEQNG